MRVILNSDVLYGDFASHGLPSAVVRLDEACVANDHKLVIPTTTLLELERRQSGIVAGQRDSVLTAQRTLEGYGATVSEFEVSSLIPDVDIDGLFRGLRSDVETARPLLEDFEDAHRRACLHQLPHPPDIKSDEMRDLVIWAIALRLSREDGHALLVSKDEVHVHPRGDIEASAVNLVRVDSVDAALEYFDVTTPAGEQLESLLASSWSRLRDAGLPIGDEPTLLSVKHVQFLQGWSGPSSASGHIKIRGQEAVHITADLEIEVDLDSDLSLTLANIKIGAKAHEPVSVKTPRTVVDDEGAQTEASLRALRDILREDSE